MRANKLAIKKLGRQGDREGRGEKTDYPRASLFRKYNNLLPSIR